MADASITGMLSYQARLRRLIRLPNSRPCAAGEINERLVRRVQSSKECSGHGKVDRCRELAILFEQRPDRGGIKDKGVDVTDRSRSCRRPVRRHEGREPANARVELGALLDFVERVRLPTYLDIHDIPGVKAADVVGAHEADLKVQGKYGVKYKAWRSPLYVTN